MLACLQPITLYNESLLPQRVVCHLCDADRNPTAQENVRIQLAKDKGLTVSERSDPWHSSLLLLHIQQFRFSCIVFLALCCHVSLQLSPAPGPIKTDKRGRVDFGMIAVVGKV